MRADDVADSIPDRERGIECRLWVLVNDLDVLPESMERPTGKFVQVPAVELDTPLRGSDEAEESAADGRLAAPRFADQSKNLALPNRKRDAVYGVHVPLPSPEKPLKEVLEYGIENHQVLDAKELASHSYPYG